MFTATHYIKAGHGVWDCTRYPIGGKFFRTIVDLPVIASGLPILSKYGYVIKLLSEDGRVFYAQESSFEILDCGDN